MQKNEKNAKKNAKKFAYIKKKLYLCTEFEKRTKLQTKLKPKSYE